ncbi:sensor histidine kinase [Phaeacidiphilus oryzae]|uniref:sensor histidine kinase n=1 Tax=Phaeacidiphilus oryzae TaxID=348818 RepID=UPI000A3EBE07|nr:ATP-binding protein [Phaeacidiphilus oryzae]
MTRRIALVVLALIAVLLTAAVVPLGLSLSGRERTSFRDETAGTARSISSAAEEHLSDHQNAPSLHETLAEAEEHGQCAVVYDTRMRLDAATACPSSADGGPGQSDRLEDLSRQVLAHPETAFAQYGDRLLVAVPVGDETRPVGAVALSRSADPLDDRIGAMWMRLALIGALGLVAGALVSVALARWVGRPLLAVDAAADRLGEGDLEARAPDDHGPAEVRRLGSTFNTMAARLEALVHGHRAVVADVAHQLRTPLAALRLRLDLLAADAEPGADAERELTAAQEEIARLSRLVDGLLAVERAENAVPRPVTVRVDRVIMDRVSAWEPVAQERSVALEVRRREPRLAARMGEGDLEQILDNLIANALDALPEGAHVRIGAEALPRRGAVVVRVVDDGPGMSAEARSTAFHRFGNPEASGSGLGLAIVHRLATANGGRVRLADTPGGGLTAVIELPAERGIFTGS